MWLEGGKLPVRTAAELQGQFRPLGQYRGLDVLWKLDLGEDMRFASARELLGSEEEFALVSQVLQLDDFFRSHAFCGVCGSATLASERSVFCELCTKTTWPRISPCVIVVLTDRGRVLLAQHVRHKTPLWTCVAGFIEVGETVESCVAREVKEETNLEITGLKYIGSQPWPFPSNLMLGFTARVKDPNELLIDTEELADARWFPQNSLPKDLAPKGTMARRLIGSIESSDKYSLPGHPSGNAIDSATH